MLAAPRLGWLGIGVGIGLGLGLGLGFGLGLAVGLVVGLALRLGRCAPSAPSVVGASFTGRMSKEIVCGWPERKMLPVQSLAAKVKASAP